MVVHNGNRDQHLQGRWEERRRGGCAIPRPAPAAGPVGAHFQFVGTDPALDAAGKADYEYRAALDAMDRAVLDAAAGTTFHRLRPRPRLRDRRGRLGPDEEPLPLDASDIIDNSIRRNVQPLWKCAAESRPQVPSSGRIT